MEYRKLPHGDEQISVIGVGISVMKPFAGGQLLDEKTFLFGRSLTHTQCIQYALDRPAVLTVLPGVRSVEDLQVALKYASSTPEERDYSVIGEFTPQSAEGCVYCNHCQPCPKGLMWGLSTNIRTLPWQAMKWQKAIMRNFRSTPATV